jgi:hypothetical protein
MTQMKKTTFTLEVTLEYWEGPTPEHIIENFLYEQRRKPYVREIKQVGDYLTGDTDGHSRQTAPSPDDG